MNIAGKLFGRVGRTPSSGALRASTTSCPGFCWWYSLQLAKSYEVTAKDTPASPG